MIKKIVRSITPPAIWDLARFALGRSNQMTLSDTANPGPDRPDLEYVDFYGNTSLFALEVLRQRGPLGEMRLLSLGNKMAHLADYLALFGTIYHNTMIQTVVPVSPQQSLAELILLREDFFGLPPLQIDCVISQASIHCLNDTRYGNAGSTDGWQKPYQAADKLREVIGSKSIPVIVSIAAHHAESFIDDNARLGHKKFVSSFTEAGFTLQEHFFDYLCYGMPFRPEYLEVGYRRARNLPAEEQAASEYNYVIGNYYFL